MESFNEEAELERSCTPEDVYSALESKLSCSTRVLGSQLGLDTSDLDVIEQDHFNQPPRLLQVLKKCSERAVYGLTWRWIADVLKKQAVKEGRLANQIEQQYLRRHSSVSSSLTLSPLSSLTSSIDLPSPTPMETGNVALDNCNNNHHYDYYAHVASRSRL